MKLTVNHFTVINIKTVKSVLSYANSLCSILSTVKRSTFKVFTILSLSLLSEHALAQQPAHLFTELPNNCPTPDAFDIAPNGNLTLSCANFADKNSEGELLSISPEGTVTHLATVPRLNEKRKANPMGIAYDPNGALYVADARGVKKGRILKLTFKNEQLISTDIVATGINPNGLRYHDGAIYVTQLKMPKIKSKNNTSGIYRFNASDRNIKVTNTLADKQLIFSTETNNPNIQMGLDGLAFDNNGNLFTANLGDGIVYKLLLDKSGQIQSSSIYAKVPASARVDGMVFDKKGNLYLAGFGENKIFKIDVNQQVLK